MGYSSWSSDHDKTISKSYVDKSMDDVFARNKEGSADASMIINADTVRESRDSDNHPNSLAVMIMLDVTGSMGKVPNNMVRGNLSKIMDVLVAHDINGAHILFGGIGDHTCDTYPLQVGQFEAGAEELHKCMTDLYIEKGGGGQDTESYLLAYHVAANNTSIDCFEKRNQKGFLFTVGDEKSYSQISREQLEKFLGPLGTQKEMFTDKELLQAVQDKYHVYHIHVQEGSYRNDPDILGYWRDLIGQHLIILEDQETISELIAAYMALDLGRDASKVAASVSDKAALVIRNQYKSSVSVRDVSPIITL